MPKVPSAQCKTQSQRGPEVLIQVQKTRLRAPPPFLYLPRNPLPQNTPLSPLAPASPLGPSAPGSPGQPRRMVSLLEPSRSRTFTSAEQHKHQLVYLGPPALRATQPRQTWVDGCSQNPQPSLQRWGRSQIPLMETKSILVLGNWTGERGIQDTALLRG